MASRAAMPAIWRLEVRTRLDLFGQSGEHSPCPPDCSGTRPMSKPFPEGARPPRSSLCTAQMMATGPGGPPAEPVKASGGPEKSTWYFPASAHACESPSKSNISPSARPM